MVRAPLRRRKGVDESPFETVTLISLLLKSGEVETKTRINKEGRKEEIVFWQIHFPDLLINFPPRIAEVIHYAKN